MISIVVRIVVSITVKIAVSITVRIAVSITVGIIDSITDSIIVSIVVLSRSLARLVVGLICNYYSSSNRGFLGYYSVIGPIKRSVRIITVASIGNVIV